MSELHESNPNAGGRHRLSGGMGVSSEREGSTGAAYAGRHAQVATDGERDTSTPPLPEDPPPEQEPGNPEENPSGIPPKPWHPEANPGHSHG